MTTKYEYAACGMFTKDWNNPPAPFNPDFDPSARQRFHDVTASMEADNFYASHTREECRIEWAERYTKLSQ